MILEYNDDEGNSFKIISRERKSERNSAVNE
jgi:hypothetical protein